MCTTMKLSPTNLPSIHAYKQFDCTRTEIEYAAKRFFYLQHLETEVQACFSNFYLVFWSGNYIIEKMKNGVIQDSLGTPYHVQFVGNLTRGGIIEANSKEQEGNLPNSQYMLSFRQPKKEFELSNYVLISRIVRK